MSRLGAIVGFPLGEEDEDVELRTWLRCLTPIIAAAAPIDLVVHLVATREIHTLDIETMGIAFAGETSLHPIPPAELIYDPVNNNYIHQWTTATLPPIGRYQIVGFLRFKTQREVWRFPSFGAEPFQIR